MKKYIIYKITNLVNGKIYIGSTRQRLSKRWCGHKYDAKYVTHGGLLYKAMNKYGFSNFKIEEIFNVFDVNNLELIEKEFIITYRSNDDKFGYNIHDPVVGNGEILSIVNKREWQIPEKRKRRIENMIKKSKYRNKAIVSVNVESGLVTHYESIHQAMRSGFAASSICNSLKRACLTGQKHVWFYFDNHTDEYYKTKTEILIGGFKREFCTPLKKIDLKTGEERIYDDIYKIQEDGYSIKEILRGMRKGYKKIKGCEWSFAPL